MPKAVKTGAKSDNRRWVDEEVYIDVHDRVDAPHVVAMRARMRRRGAV